MKKSICFARDGLFGLMILVLVLGPWVNAEARQVTQRARLRQLSRFFYQQLQGRRPQMYHDLLRSDALPQQQLNENPDIQLMYIKERGHPVYYMVENLNAAKTIGTDDVWPGGRGGFSLSGSGTALGELCIWDAGGVLTTHQEFDGRVTQMDSPGGTHYHATHVAGTMVAEGEDVDAKGMSFEGALAAYDWDNDNSEMASAAASGMNVSNHSYGFATGWYWSGDWYWFGDITVSTIEDYGFGFYGSEAQAWDEIAHNAPYYTIIKSAGNDRNDAGPAPDDSHYVWDPDSVKWVWSTDTRDPDGGTDGYDCIPWSGAAKNIITVGAIEDIPGGYTGPEDVVMSDFSGWGPTDDGRIKPDVVANGISLYSCTDASNSSYASYSGTSMSAPNLSGSLNLLVRHYEATHGDSTPLSSTMKAVVIQTADEAGPNPGPDYMFGWGLMNTLKAAQIIEADAQEPGRIIEGSLANGETDTIVDCLYSNRTGPIRVTLAWTDPPGTPPPPSLNPTTPMLVNDLDLRLEHVATSTIYEPYVLDLDNPDNPAGTGDNVRDNVEQVYIASPFSGSYNVIVSHKGALTAPQYYSIVSFSENEEYFIRGDFNTDGTLMANDPLMELSWIFGVYGDVRPPCEDAADYDDNGQILTNDPLMALQFIFGVPGSVPPEPPYGYFPDDCGIDPTEDELTCGEHVCIYAKAAMVYNPSVSVEGAVNRLEVGEVTSVDGLVRVPVDLTLSEVVCGFDISLGYDVSSLQFKEVVGGDGYDFYAVDTREDGVVRIGCVPDIEMAELMGAGTHRVGEILFTVERKADVALNWRNVEVYGSDVEPLSVEWVNGVVKVGTGLPEEFALNQNYPNPFNPTTLIKYDLPVDCQVRLDVYNVLGQKVAALVDVRQKAGYKSARWNATDFASGIYFYRISAGDFISNRKMVLLK